MLRFLFTEINYGGRVTDDKDRRLISNLVNGFVGPNVLDSSYSFSPSGGLHRFETLGWVRALPDLFTVSQPSGTQPAKLALAWQELALGALLQHKTCLLPSCSDAAWHTAVQCCCSG